MIPRRAIPFRDQKKKTELTGEFVPHQVSVHTDNLLPFCNLNGSVLSHLAVCVPEGHHVYSILPTLTSGNTSGGAPVGVPPDESFCSSSGVILSPLGFF